MEIFDNFVLWTTLLSWGIAQVFKVIITLIVDKKFSFERLLGDGGMPSSHSATVSCLAILIGWYVGFDSVMFALAAVFAVVVMHDASGVRRETGKQALSIKELANAVNELFVNKERTPPGRPECPQWFFHRSLHRRQGNKASCPRPFPAPFR